jgi:CheY-like chemotaxis protein
MTDEQKYELYKQVIKWGGIAIICSVVLVLFKPSLSSLIDRAEEVKVTAGKDFELAIKAGINIAQAEVRRSGKVLSESDVTTIAEDAQKVDVEKLSEKTILWVDDNPTNNIHEINAFKQLGIDVISVGSGDEAVQIIKNQSVDVIVSDFKRANDPRYAGYGLLHELKNLGKHIPYVIYSVSTTPKYRADARKQGAVDQTSRAVELFSAVMSSLVNG